MAENKTNQKKKTRQDKKVERKREKAAAKANEKRNAAEKKRAAAGKGDPGSAKSSKSSNNAKNTKTKGASGSKKSKSTSKTTASKRSEEKRLRAKTPSYAITPVNRSRIAFGFAVILLLMMVLILRMGYWQIIRADELRIMATEMQKVDTEIDPNRGSIYDSRMNVLAESVTEYELYAYSQPLYKSSELEPGVKASSVKILSEITGKSTDKITEILSGNENLVMVADDLSKDQVDSAREAFDSNVVIKTRVSRYYPNGAFAAQVVGGVDANNSGRSGLEYQYNSELAGVKGRTVRTIDATGDPLSSRGSRYYKAKDGASIVTTIDSVIQHFVEDALETGMDENGADAITCIVMDPKTGDILAMATNPEYDPNNSNEPSDPDEKEDFENMSEEEQSEYLSRMWTIRGISDVYEPGSTFKLITAAAALETGTSNDESKYYCDGSIDVANYNLKCLDAHGWQDLNHAVGNSCNPALAQVAMDIGGEDLYNVIDMFGFDDKTGVDLPGETNSIVKDPKTMTIVDLATTGYGQGIAVTPLQILCAVNTFGNEGVLMKPKIVKKIVDKDGKTIKEFEDVEVRRAISEATTEKMKEMMEFYVSDGGGTTAYVPGYRVGGKTGTANFVEGSGYSSATNTSFVAMAPMDDPKISMICIVYRPTKKQYGANTAGPIVKEITEKTLQYMGVERVYSQEEKRENEINYVKVPDVTGSDSSAAKNLIKYEGLEYIVMPESDENNEFLVVDQYPKAGTKVEEGSVVYIYSE